MQQTFIKMEMTARENKHRQVLHNCDANIVFPSAARAQAVQWRRHCCSPRFFAHDTKRRNTIPSVKNTVS